MTDTNMAAPPVAAPPPAAPSPPSQPPAAPWYQGKADAETVGHWQNKGWKLDDPHAIAIEATKAAREAQKFVGLPPDQLLKLPKDANDAEGWKAVHTRLGVPAEAKDYDLSGVKTADGKDIAPALADTMRAALHKARVAKDAAPEVVKAVVQHLAAADTAAAAERAAKLTIERTELAKNWGNQFEFNKLTAMQGAKRLGVDPDLVAQLEGQIGYAKVMEMFRRIGAATSEDTFVEGNKSSGDPTTKEGAQARLNLLMADKDWAARLLRRDAATMSEWQALTQLIAA